MGKAARQINAKQAKFVKEYLVDFNATQAAIRAGYSERSSSRIGPELLGKTWISDAVNHGRAVLAKKLDISAERVLNELARVAFSDMRNYVQIGSGGSLRINDPKDLTEDQTAAISEMSETTSEHGGSLKFRLHDKIRALELLGKNLKLFTDKLEHTGKDGESLMQSFVDLVRNVAKAKLEAPKP